MSTYRAVPLSFLHELLWFCGNIIELTSNPDRQSRYSAQKSRSPPRCRNSPLTKSAWLDSVARGWWRWVSDGSGSTAGSSVGDVGGVVGDATLAGSRLLRPAAGRAYSGRVRQLRRGALHGALRRAPRPSLAAAGPLLPHAAGRLLRRYRQRARPGMALRRQPVPAGVPAAR